jgi:hypothetical protein
MTRRRVMTDDDAESAWVEYCAWRDALRNLHPKRLAEKYGVHPQTLLKYVRQRAKRAA